MGIAGFLGRRFLHGLVLTVITASGISPKMADIVAVVSSDVELSPQGSALRGNCPFHDDNDRTFYVFPQLQTWRCFGSCTGYGGVFTYYMLKHDCPFEDAWNALRGRPKE